ncbi:unnamed protein product [Penicillium discolor]
MSLLTKPNHLTYEQHFERECELFQDALLREAYSLHLLEDRRAETIKVICDLIVYLEVIARLAERMARKSRYFLGEFQDFCSTRILPGLVRSLNCLKESTTIYRDINYTVAGQLEAAHEDMAFILDSRE